MVETLAVVVRDKDDKELVKIHSAITIEDTIEVSRVVVCVNAPALSKGLLKVCYVMLTWFACLHACINTYVWEWAFGRPRTPLDSV